jgi:hypothetical protein
MQSWSPGIMLVQKNTDSWHARKGDLHHVFPLDVPLVTSPKLSFIANNNNPTGVSIALGTTIHFGSLEFTVDCLGRLSLSPDERDSSAIFIGIVHTRLPSSHTALEYSSDEVCTPSSTEGRSRSPGPRGCNVDEIMHMFAASGVYIEISPWPPPFTMMGRQGYAAALNITLS